MASKRLFATLLSNINQPKVNAAKISLMLLYQLIQSSDACLKVFIETFNIIQRKTVICINPSILAKLGSIGKVKRAGEET